MEQCSSEHTAEYKARLVARLVGVENFASSDLNNDCSRPSAGEETTPKQQEIMFGTVWKGRSAT